MRQQQVQEQQRQQQEQQQEPVLQQQVQEQERQEQLLLFCHMQTGTEPTERRAVRNVSLFLSFEKLHVITINVAGYSNYELGRQPTRRILYTFVIKCYSVPGKIIMNK
ncbi:MAG: hypothetical protein K8H84_05705 [Sulfuricella denitrificans]|nr:hypothetical protein [Sulfuricella denitrificans]